MRTVSALTMLPPRLRDTAALPSGLLPATALVTSYVGFITGLVQVAQPETVEQRILEQSVVVLHESVIAEAAAPRPAATEPLVERIDLYIAAHLLSLTLSPTSIARDLGASLRAVHGAYRDRELTVAAEIRRRRVMAAIDLLARADPTLTMARISREVGFSSPDQLRRSFVAITGRSTADYRNPSE